MFSTLLTIAGIHLVALASPGPDFFFVSQTAVSKSRTEALFGVAGITLGVAFWAALSLLGLQIIFDKFFWLQSLITFLGGIYLCYLAFLLIRGALKSSAQQQVPKVELKASLSKTFLFGLATNLSNPKAVIYFSSIFSVFLLPSMGTQERMTIFSLVTIESFVWFAFIALFFGMPSLKKGYQKSAKYIDGLSGLVFGIFGLGLIWKSKDFFASL